MDQISFYIVTSDATSYILPATCYLYNKYWNVEGGQKFKILGNNLPKITLPENFEFIKIKSENNLNKWTKYLYDYINVNEKNEYFIFTLDDYLPNGYFNPIFNDLLNYVKTNKAGRVALGKLDVEKWDAIKKMADYEIVKLKQDTIYRLSCQTSIWNKEYFLKNFNNNWTPWELELKGSKLAQNDNWDILGTNKKWAFSWVEESALSGRWPDMINILGMKPEDVKYLLDQKIFKPENLQYGIWYDCKIPFLSKFQSISKKMTKIPKFSEIGLNFKWNLIKPYIRNKTFNRLYFRYSDIYGKQ